MNTANKQVEQKKYKYVTKNEKDKMPEPYAISSLDEWARNAVRKPERGFGLKETEYRWIEKIKDGRKRTFKARIEWYDDCAFAIVTPFWNNTNKKVWIYKIGCSHDNMTKRELGRRSYNSYTCEDCGYSYFIDSSD